MVTIKSTAVELGSPHLVLPLLGKGLMNAYFAAKDTTQWWRETPATKTGKNRGITASELTRSGRGYEIDRP